MGRDCALLAPRGMLCIHWEGGIVRKYFTLSSAAASVLIARRFFTLSSAVASAQRASHLTVSCYVSSFHVQIFSNSFLILFIAFFHLFKIISFKDIFILFLLIILLNTSYSV